MDGMGMMRSFLGQIATPPIQTSQPYAFAWIFCLQCIPSYDLYGAVPLEFKAISPLVGGRATHLIVIIPKVSVNIIYEYLKPPPSHLVMFSLIPPFLEPKGVVHRHCFPRWLHVWEASIRLRWHPAHLTWPPPQVATVAGRGLPCVSENCVNSENPEILEITNQQTDVFEDLTWIVEKLVLYLLL